MIQHLHVSLTALEISPVYCHSSTYFLLIYLSLIFLSPSSLFLPPFLPLLLLIIAIIIIVIVIITITIIIVIITNHLSFTSLYIVERGYGNMLKEGEEKMEKYGEEEGKDVLRYSPPNVTNICPSLVASLTLAICL